MQLKQCLWLKCRRQAQFFLAASPTLATSKPNTPNGPAHNPSGACSQPLVSKLPRGCEQAGNIAWNSTQNVSYRRRQKHL